MSTSNEQALEKAKAREVLTKSARDYLKLQITLPLGNPALKKVHTNQFLFTDLPKEFTLENWQTVAEVLKSNDTRMTDYLLNRWYVEGVETTVDIPGNKAEMKIDVNAFPSATSEYVEGLHSIEKAYTDAVNKNISSSNKASAAKDKSNATAKNNTSYFKSKAGKNVSTDLAKAAKQITKDCNTEEQKAYCIYDWVDRYVKFKMYYGYKYSSSTVLKNKIANCYDTAFLIYNLCSKVKVRCEIYNGYYHFLDGTFGHLWNKIPYKGKMTFADTGRDNPNPIGSHGGSGRYIVSGGSKPWRKNY